MALRNEGRDHAKGRHRHDRSGSFREVNRVNVAKQMTCPPDERGDVSALGRKFLRGDDESALLQRLDEWRHG